MHYRVYSLEFLCDPFYNTMLQDVERIYAHGFHDLGFDLIPYCQKAAEMFCGEKKHGEDLIDEFLDMRATPSLRLNILKNLLPSKMW